LAGQYPVNSEITIEEVIPDGYYVSRIEVKPDRTVSRNTPEGVVTVTMVSGVIEAIYTNKVAGPPTPTRTPTSISTSTPRPTNTPPGCGDNCTATPTPIPMGRLQICKEADGSGVNGSFSFRFDSRSRSVPVGACAGLIAVEAGTLTITEDAQTGFSVADIYTIPADRLISKNLAAGTANVRIVEGTAISQTIVIFRNRAVTVTSTFTSTPTSTVTATATATGSQTVTSTATATGSVTPTFTPTFTPTSTGTITQVSCQETVVNADFSQIPAGASVEGMGRVAPGLNIDANGSMGRAVHILEGTTPSFYASRVNGVTNAGLQPGGGFGDLDARLAGAPHQYTFTFAPGTFIKDFSLHMLDFGDFNPTNSPSHIGRMIAYGAGDIVISQHELNYTGGILAEGDILVAAPGQPGNWTWQVSGPGIVKVVLEFTEGYDPNIGFDGLAMSMCQ